MKKLWTSLLFATMSAGLLAGCATSTNTATRVFDSKNDVYGFETVSAISLLHDVKFADDSSITDSSSTESSSETPTSEEPSSEEPTSSEETPIDETPVEETVDVTKYIGIMEQLLSDSPIQMVTEASDLPEYTTKMTITSTDLNGLTSTFVLYYNEIVEETPVDSSETSSEATSEESSSTEVSSDSTPVSSEGETTMTAGATKKGEHMGGHHGGGDEGDGYFGDSGMGGDHHGQDHDSEDSEEASETESEGEENEYCDAHEHQYGDSEDGDETTLEGIIIVNGVTYDLVGEKDGTELSFFVSIDENNWIKIAQDVNDTEEMYKYTIMSDGVKTKMSFKIENDDEGTKVTLKETIGADVYSYKFYKTTDDAGNEIIYIIAFEDGIVTHIKVTATIDETTGETTYTYVTLETGHTHEDHGNHGYHDGGRHGHGGR